MSASRAASVSASGKEVASDDRVSVKLRRLRGDGAIGADDNPIDPLLRLLSLSPAVPLEQGPPLIGKNRFVKLDLSAFEPAHDLLQLGKRLLETHCGDIGRNVQIGHVESY